MSSLSPTSTRKESRSSSFSSLSKRLNNGELLNCSFPDLSFFSMDSLFFDDGFFNAEGYDGDVLAERPYTGSNSDLDDRLYLVPYRWWKDASDQCFGDSEEIRGVLYNKLSDSNSRSESEIVLHLRRGDNGSEDAGDEVVRVPGHEYALLSESLWFRALKWHSDSCTTVTDIGSSLAAENDTLDLFSIHIRLSVMQQTDSLVVKIYQTDNSIDLYKRAGHIFGVKSDPLHIWDISGQITDLLTADRTMSPNSDLGQVDEEILLELQIYGLLDKGKNIEGLKVEKALEERGYTDARLLGLTGLLNLGNTCFMSSAIQCLVHTPKLVDYFLGDYKKEINYENPLGMNGKLALAFGDLLRKLWAPAGMPIAPRAFKSVLASFAPQFSGYNQHDSQEFLAFLLDGLHEDLNRVKHKPYVEAKDADGRPDDEVADEYWQNHLARNNSIIVNLFQGQYRSTLVCPICKRVSMTFDPFMNLSLPLPSTTMRTMTLAMLSTDGMTPLSVFTVTVPQYGRCKDLTQALSTACSLRNDEVLLVAEVYNNCILRFLEEPSDSLALIRDDDRLVAYRLTKRSEHWPLVVFMHQRMQRPSIAEIGKLCWRMFGIPLVTRMCSVSSGCEICKEFLKLIHPLRLDEDVADDCHNIENSDDEDTNMAEASSAFSDNVPSSENDAVTHLHLNNDFEFHLTDERGTTSGLRIELKTPLCVSGATKKLNVLVSWSDQMTRQYDTCHICLLPEIFKPGFASERPHESVSLYKCLEAFLKEEPLGPEDMWYCPKCKKHRQASKKLDLWRLPEILVFHLKRFAYSRFLKSKLETYVDFPVTDLDLSGFIANNNNTSLCSYVLYAVSNHYGSMGGGHYTALVHHQNRWYEFDDSNVHPVSEDKIRTSAAYVLFYRRVLHS
ncbi:hypothetical protein Nepgr_030935 [Nepenthes gracilis]|uniref:Ubiquitin carboxyl-terminal hydrolase n=1 Tax=Nepenthes gracilis TaxID=150966 RepID=A0AAD3TGN3_NEPGR|nr:hypothetical protein Nepgr_030935 [Nepenthes gracilis]